MEIGLSQGSSHAGAQLYVLDKNRELSLTPILRGFFKKLATMVESVLWNDEHDILAAMIDGKIVVWYYPNALFVDEELIPLLKCEKETRWDFEFFF